MYSIGDGQRKFIFNYKAIESIISEPKEYWRPNNHTSYDRKSEKSYKLIIKNCFSDKEKSSNYFINKSKQMKKLKEDIQTKKLDILINKALEKSNPIRNYSINLKNNINRKNINKNNIFFPNIKIQNNLNNIPKYSKDIVRNNMMKTAHNFFPERYINIEEINKDDNNKCNARNKIKTNKSLFDEYKKIYSIKYITSGPINKESKEEKLKRKAYKLISPAIKIYNKKNKNKLFWDFSKDNINKKIDVGLNTILYLH